MYVGTAMFHLFAVDASFVVTCAVGADGAVLLALVNQSWMDDLIVEFAVLCALAALVFAELAVDWAADAALLADAAVTVSVEMCFDVSGGLNTKHSVNCPSFEGSTNLPRIMSVALFHVHEPPTAEGVGIAAYFQPESYQTM